MLAGLVQRNSNVLSCDSHNAGDWGFSSEVGGELSAETKNVQDRVNARARVKTSNLFIMIISIQPLSLVAQIVV